MLPSFLAQKKNKYLPLIYSLTDSRSKLLVGSSSTNIWGSRNDTAAKATLDLCPPLRAEQGVVCKFKLGASPTPVINVVVEMKARIRI